MIKGETVTVYNWFDIEVELCRRMGIEPDQFRDYHTVVGGDYRDLWHVALESVVPDNMTNGTIMTMYPLDDIEWCVEKAGDWTRPFFEAYNALLDELDPDFHGIEVRFSW